MLTAYISDIQIDTEKEERIPDHIDLETTTNLTLPSFPEISESIDSVPEDYSITIEETIHAPKQTEEIIKTSSTSRPSTTTKKNFRIVDPYYSMYYDN